MMTPYFKFEDQLGDMFSKAIWRNPFFFFFVFQVGSWQYVSSIYTHTHILRMDS